MAKIGIDVDGVLANFCEAFSAHARWVFGKDKVPQGYVPHDWNWTDVITMEEQNILWKELKAIPDFWLGLKSFSSNVKAISGFLREHGRKHDVWFVTARAQCAGDSIAYQSKYWLQHELGYLPESLSRGVITVAKPDLKQQVIEGIGITYFIDDNGPTVEGFDKMPGVDGCLLDAPWNQDSKVRTRVASMKEFLERIEPCPKQQLVTPKIYSETKKSASPNSLQ